MNQVLTLYPSVSITRSLTLKISLKILWAASFIVLLFLLGFYIFQVNDLTKKIYSIQNYEDKLEELSFEAKNSEISFSTVNSLATLESQIQNLNLEKVNQIKYIKVLDSQVAKNTSSLPRP
ncbi:MAG: hypothetical protein COX90_00365 [Candidatus Nealsonbacteria bacterium CG_4_10_14_0_2_um_filter_38_17]|uniref:Uncharacterized protein n=2 Tax=Candidatus Nealsoniibacteriota TaxID=1817911 RepID=A0A2M7UZ44_9BACT|nr:MAG: hypothetical protein COX36_04070 [Candidatus Nealsonbacteria bacterium CG23_combo_of_CG06-09_8_20_14_all_38_19]PIZ89239.1 MAG: hypothetical protein COX90_00365 [Candidatus Nealsonbacteria bacterium CG_4_10_14_0_2_um_filter_38_17]